MYIAIGQRVIVKKREETVTASGIITTPQEEGAVFELEVVATPEEHKRFLAKTIYAERRHIIELPDRLDGERHGSLKVDDIIAIKDERATD